MPQSTFQVTITKEMIENAITAVGGDSFKLHAIKEMRIRYGIGLREAKDLVETVIPKKREYRRTIIVTRTYEDYTMATSEEEAKNNPLPLWVEEMGGEIFATTVTVTATGY